MADTFLHDLKLTLDNCISEVDSIKWMFCTNPISDFTRNRKISFKQFCNFMIQLQSKSLPNEVMDFFGHSADAPSKSAFIQQRDKFCSEGWKFLLQLFVNECHSLNDALYKGYRILAADGSDVNISRNPNDSDSFIDEGEKGYNAIHVNAMYDILNHTYYDISVQGKKKLHERKALNSMISLYRNEAPCICMADRGFEGWNQFAHFIEANQKFVIRMKDIDSNGILSSYDLPNSEYDEYIETTLTRRHTKETMGKPEIYTIIAPYTDFDYFEESPYYQIRIRIVRFVTKDGKYISVATNLSEDEFPLEEIKKLYNLRWSEETSFRQLKYTIGLINWHSKKPDAIMQELYARVILYNFCEMVNCHAVVTVKDNANHSYQVNFSTTTNICRSYLHNGGDEVELMLLIQRHLLPIRHDRIYPLKLRPKRNRDFMYRPA